MEILNKALYDDLLRKVDAAVSRQPSLADGRARVGRPLALLVSMARVAPQALGDDSEAAQRLSLLLAMAAPHGVPAQALDAFLDAGDGSGGASADGGSPINSDTFSSLLGVHAIPSDLVEASTWSCCPGLILHGPLVVVALAAARVGAAVNLAPVFVDSVFGLALAASAAEALARSLAAGLDDPEVETLLAATAGSDTRDGRVAAAVANFLVSPCERARWRCLERLRARVRRQTANVHWDAASGIGIASVEPSRACPGTRVRITARPDGTIGVTANLSPSTLPRAYWFVPRCGEVNGNPATAAVVLAAQRGIAVAADQISLSEGWVEFVVPAGARADWLGFCDSQLLKTSNEQRASLRAEWDQVSQEDTCLRERPVPTDMIPSLPDPPRPPAAGAPRISIGTPAILSLSLSPPRVAAGETLRLRWQVAGASEIELEPSGEKVAASGVIEMAAPSDRQQISQTLIARNPCGEESATVAVALKTRIRGVEFSQNGATLPLVEGEPLDLVASLQPSDAQIAGTCTVDGEPVKVASASGELRATLDASLVRPGMTGTISALGPLGEVDDQASFAPDITTLASRRIVLVRPPTWNPSFARVRASQARALLLAAGRRVGQAVDVMEPAWIDDEVLSISGDPDGEATPTVDALLERLAILAATQPGLEDALWLALLPGKDEGPLRANMRGRSLFRLLPAAGAAAVAVATPEALPRVLAAALPDIEPVTRRLRLCGEIRKDGDVDLQPIRLEERAAGQGAPVDSGLVVVGLDEQGHERTSSPLCLTRQGLPAHFACLLPVSPDVAAIDVRPAASTLASRLRKGAAFGPWDSCDPLFHAYRFDGQPILEALAIEDGCLQWSYDHTQGAHADLSVEVSAGGPWSPLLSLRTCRKTVEPPLRRLRQDRHRVRLVATDGWNTTEAYLESRVTPTGPRVLIRRGPDRQLWADNEDEESQVVWQWGKRTQESPAIKLERGFAGTVTLTLASGQGQDEVVVDSEDG
jgi:hypothetical protein